MRIIWAIAALGLSACNSSNYQGVEEEEASEPFTLAELQAERSRLALEPASNARSYRRAELEEIEQRLRGGPEPALARAGGVSETGAETAAPRPTAPERKPVLPEVTPAPTPVAPERKPVLPKETPAPRPTAPERKPVLPEVTSAPTPVAPERKPVLPKETPAPRPPPPDRKPPAADETTASQKTPRDPKPVRPPETADLELEAQRRRESAERAKLAEERRLAEERVRAAELQKIRSGRKSKQWPSFLTDEDILEIEEGPYTPAEVAVLYLWAKALPDRTTEDLRRRQREVREDLKTAQSRLEDGRIRVDTAMMKILEKAVGAR